MSESRIVGYVVGEATPIEATFIALKPPRLGQYVTLPIDGREYLAMVQAVICGDVILNEEIHDPNVVKKIKKIRAEKGETGRYLKARLMILGDAETFRKPRIPPSPGTEICEADIEILNKVFSQYTEDNVDVSVPIGTLIAHPEVKVHLNVNKLLSRHLAILAVTGAGKSNTVAVLTDGIVKLGGCVVIFDMHSEYGSAKYGNVDPNIIRPKLNPWYLSVEELMVLMRIYETHYRQRSLFRRVYKTVKSYVEEKAREEKLTLREKSQMFIEQLESHLERLSERGETEITIKNSESKIKTKRDIAFPVYDKFCAFMDEYKGVVSMDADEITKCIRCSCANIIELGELDENAADVVVSHTLAHLLIERKKHKLGLETSIQWPLLAVIEEAHILAPIDRSTLSKYVIGRIAREGRKFGLGLCLVSQRPKSLDPMALSQANNMIILRLVEPNDQKHVQAASETLSNELLAHLPALNTGEGIIIGMMTNFPALVKI
ncbi:hypothetical protein DRO21_05980, partial [archaeon]